MNKKLIKILILIVLVIVSISVVMLLNTKADFIIKNTFLRITTNEISKVEEIDTINSTSINLMELLDLENVYLDDSLMLVNKKYPLSQSYEADTVFLEERKVSVNSCIENSWYNLSEDILQQFDKTLYISSAYRTQEDQIRIKNEEGDTAQEPGCSEHQTGLAVDVFVEGFSGEGFIDSEEGQFINKKCGDYGFIIRYPAVAKAKTGITFEPWHLRYVGYPHSKIINESYISFEGYVSLFKNNKWYSYEDYIIIRTDSAELEVPTEFEKAVVSFDNMGGAILTFKI